MIFDSHAHYDDEAFDEDRHIVVRELKENGIIGVLNCGSSIEGARTSVKLSQQNDIFYAAVGIHPEYADKFNDEILKELKELASFEKVRAIGEIGLDYHYEENPDREIQKNALRQQMNLAKELSMPVVIHDRDAHEDTLKILKEFPEVNGVVHCFSGSLDMAEECVKMGYYIGVTGVVTFNNAKKIVEVVKNIPLNRLLVETDCPYMTPTPYRGKRNRSEYILNILQKIAEIKSIPYEEVEYRTIQNITELLKLK